jgi:hypothetical protein
MTVSILTNLDIVSLNDGLISGVEVTNAFQALALDERKNDCLSLLFLALTPRPSVSAMYLEDSPKRALLLHSPLLHSSIGKR